MTNLSNWIGIDDHADKWTIAYFRGSNGEAEREWELEPSESGYRKLIGCLKEMRGAVHVVYEAGPCGYELYRRLQKAGVDCCVAAPSLTPRKPGDRIKTNRRDARKLARMLRAGELTRITVPDERQESIRDLVRAREAANKDVLRARHQLSKLLLRHGYRYRDGKAWTQRFWAWVARIELAERFPRRERRRCHTAIHSSFLQSPLQFVPAWPRFVDHVHRTAHLFEPADQLSIAALARLQFPLPLRFPVRTPEIRDRPLVRVIVYPYPVAKIRHDPLLLYVALHSRP